MASISISNDGRHFHVTAELQVLLCNQNGIILQKIDELQLWTYAKTPDQSYPYLQSIIKYFFSYWLEKKLMHHRLASLGWQVKRNMPVDPYRITYSRKDIFPPYDAKIIVQQQYFTFKKVAES